jgi:hypothetical protein
MIMLAKQLILFLKIAFQSKNSCGKMWCYSFAFVHDNDCLTSMNRLVLFILARIPQMSRMSGDFLT